MPSKITAVDDPAPHNQELETIMKYTEQQIQTALGVFSGGNLVSAANGGEGNVSADAHYLKAEEIVLSLLQR